MRIHPAIVFFQVAVLFAAALTLACGEKHPKWTTATGLQITEIAEGSGPLPKKGDIVSIVYTASYLGGKQFDSYQDREDPYRFMVGMTGMLPGLEEGVSTMRVGARRILVLPPKLAFEHGGRPATVPADTWVRFEVELLDLEPGPPLPEPWSDAGYDIEVTKSGLQFVDIAVGSGELPGPRSTVMVHYSGYLDDGTLFDSSVLQGAPIEFEMASGQLIPGMLEGLATMHVGGLRKLIIPPHLGYGEKGFGKKIPPNATLTYDVELISVRNPAADESH